jgi:hypothetical protein
MKKILILLLVLCVQTVFAQDAISTDSVTYADLQLIARPGSKSVMLRWAPASATVWRAGNAKGYMLERMEMTESGAQSGFVSLGHIKPYTREQWKTQANLDDDYVKAMAQTLFSKAPVPESQNDLMAWKEMAEQEQSLYVMAVLSADLSKGAAEAGGLFFEDKTIESGKTYAYRLFVPDLETTVDTALLIVDSGMAMATPSVEGFRGFGADGKVELYWARQQNAARFSAYHVERSADGGRHFDRITSKPLFVSGKAVADNMYTDSVDMVTSYQYRIIGITPFGDEGQPSSVVEVKARKVNQAMGATGLKAEGDMSKVEIQWNLVSETAHNAGFVVMRALDANGPFVPLHEGLLPKSARSFTDKNPVAMMPNFYRVHAVNNENAFSYSETTLALIRDEEPPAAPIGLTGLIDSSGKVSLAWELGKEADLKGYRVYRANRENDVYIQLTPEPLPGNFFVDTVTMQSLNEVVYYRISAVDHNYNHSAYSTVLALKRPDLIAPAAPAIRDYLVDQKAVWITWYPSSSSDVAEHMLQRKEVQENAGWETVSRLDGTSDSFRDTTVLLQKRYQYRVLAQDDAGNQSISRPIQVWTVDNGLRKGISDFTGNIEKDQRQSLLSWRYDAEGDYRFVVYRAEGDGALKSYKSLPAGQMEFSDVLRKSGQYKYAVKVLFADGGESRLSEPVLIEL